MQASASRRGCAPSEVPSRSFRDARRGLACFTLVRGTEGARDVARRASATADGPTFFACDPPDEVKPPPVSEEEAKLRNACKVGVSDKLQVVDEVELKVICQSAVERKLKSPKSAKFPGVFDNDAFAK